MRKIAIVVQRCHESITGGSECLAWQYATLLRSNYDVEILTTTARDHCTWANELPVGDESRDGVLIRRFPTDRVRSPFWGSEMEHLLRRAVGPINWSTARGEEFLRQQGPHSKALLGHLRENAREFESILFITYLFATAYFGIQCVPSSRAILVPTLHDEITAYLKVYRLMAQRVARVFWLTDAERRFSSRLWGELPGSVTAMAVDTVRVTPASISTPMILYCGRIETSKGCQQLVDYFLQWKRESKSPMRLVLTGEDNLPLPRHPAIEFRGFVSNAERSALMAAATAFIMPSQYESFSLATLEAMAQETPVLVNAKCHVLLDHVQHSGGGKAYHNYSEFAAALNHLCRNPSERSAMGRRARQYVVDRYETDRIRARLIEEVEASVRMRIAA